MIISAADIQRIRLLLPPTPWLLLLTLPSAVLWIAACHCLFFLPPPPSVQALLQRAQSRDTIFVVLTESSFELSHDGGNALMMYRDDVVAHKGMFGFAFCGWRVNGIDFQLLPGIQPTLLGDQEFQLLCKQRFAQYINKYPSDFPHGVNGDAVVVDKVVMWKSLQKLVVISIINIIVAHVSWMLYMRAQRRRRIRLHLCASCGYHIYHSCNKCPECGCSV